MSQWKQLDRWLVLYVVCPLLVLLVVVNLILWSQLDAAHHRFLTEGATTSAMMFDNILHTYGVRVKSLAHLPTTRDLLGARERLTKEVSTRGRRDSAAEVEGMWEQLDEGDLRVREVLHNEVGEIFNQVCLTDDILENLLLTDSEGFLLAASSKPPNYTFEDTAWWNTLRAKGLDVVVSEGFSKEGMLRLGMAIQRSPTYTNSVFGVIRADLNVERVLDQISFEDAEDEWAALLVGNRSRFAAGEKLLFSSVGSLINDEVTAGRVNGYRGGVRFRSVQIMGGVDWAEPMYMVFLRKEPAIAWSVWIPVIISVLISLGVLIGVVYVARRAMARRFLSPSKEVTEAGVWVLQSALGRTLDSMMPELRSQIVSGRDLTPLQKDLERWLSTMRQGYEDEMVMRTTKMQRDLELAKDFQRAMLERPYPRIPDVHIEGRLRLDFHHNYEPASALGGDFFDILTLGPDCAGIFIADVMGHGTRSALITAILRTLLGDLLPQGRNAPHFLSEVNKAFCSLLKSVPSPLFASAFYFVTDTTARVATFSSAGHPPPFHLRRSLGRITRIETPQPRGTALGVIPDESYSGGHCRLIPEDVFIFFTDGVYEAHNAEGDEFGIARMEKILRKAMYKKNGRQIVDELLRNLKEFVGDEDMDDDVCIVSVEVTTRAPERRE